MAFDLEYNESLDCIVIHATGELGYEDFPGLARDLLGHPDFRTNIGQIYDGTDSDLNLSTDELARVAEDFGQASEVLGTERKLAFVVARDLDFGKLRQYEAFFAAGTMVEVQIFRSMDDARRWMGE